MAKHAYFALDFRRKRHKRLRVVSRHIHVLIVPQYTMIAMDLLRIPLQHKQFLDMAVNVCQTNYSVLYYIKYQYN